MRAAGRLALALLVLAALSCGGKSPTRPEPEADSDGDGVPDASDRCPTVAGEAQYDGCPWYEYDVCSAASPYALQGPKWADPAPTFACGTSLPLEWRAAADQAVATWNAAGSRLAIRKSAALVAAGTAHDGRSVVCYGALDPGILGRTYSWYSTETGALLEADIELNSQENLTLGGSPTSYDVVSILTHEFGHFCGLDHVSDRTQTMYPELPPGCTIYRTLCAGDMLGLRRRYP